MTPARPAGTPGGRRAGSTAARPGGRAASPAAARPRPAAAPARQPDAADGVPAQAPAVARDEPAVDAPQAAGARRGGAPWWLVAATSALAVLAVVGLAVVLLSRPSEADLRASALLAGRSYVADLTTYDARTLDADVEKVRKVSSPGFAKEYATNIAAVRDAILKAQTVATGTVVGAGVEKLSQNRATVLVAVNQQFQAPGQQPRTEANRVRVELVRRSGNWYLDKVTRL